jgi:hypothetical protein
MTGEVTSCRDHLTTRARRRDHAGESSDLEYEAVDHATESPDHANALRVGFAQPHALGCNSPWRGEAASDWCNESADL